jgi:hypothetical protein
MLSQEDVVNLLNAKDKRIAELEKERDDLKMPIDLGDRVILSKQALQAHNLGQQAKGIEDAIATSKIPYGRNGFGFQMYMCSRNSLLVCHDNLLAQAKALKEQGE